MNPDDQPDFIEVSLDLANQVAETQFKLSQWKVLSARYKKERDEARDQLARISNQTEEPLKATSDES